MENYFSVEAMVRGYHVYKVWESNIGERLACEIEQNNSFDMNLTFYFVIQKKISRTKDHS